MLQASVMYSHQALMYGFLAPLQEAHVLHIQDGRVTIVQGYTRDAWKDHPAGNISVTCAQPPPG